MDYSEYKDGRVIVVVKGDDDTASEIEGTVIAANAGGIVLKEKGKTKQHLLDNDEIVEVRRAEETAKPLSAKTLKLVTYGQARSHLLERHGLTLKQVNELTEQGALDFHNGLDHNGLDLGHVHEDTSQTPAAQAVASGS